jgi:uncharacterized protein YjiS (DUF1127 family)
MNERGWFDRPAVKYGETAMTALMGTAWGVAARPSATRLRGKDRFMIAIGMLIRAFDALGNWQDRARERRQLMGMSDRGLHDLGLTRNVIDSEAARPFWKE